MQVQALAQSGNVKTDDNDPTRTSLSCNYNEQNPNERYSTTVVDPLDLTDHEATCGPLDVPEALSYKEKSRRQNNYSDEH